MPRKKKSEQDARAPSVQAVGGSQESTLEDGQPRAGASVGRVIVFRLEEQIYALPIESVQEIQQIVELTPVPDSAQALVGMIDVRGHVVPAIDVRSLIGLTPVPYMLDTPMILCTAHGRLVALIVDAVDDVITLPEGCMQAPSRLYALADRMIGICRLEAGLVVVLDPDRLVPDAALSTFGDEEGGLDL